MATLFVGISQLVRPLESSLGSDSPVDVQPDAALLVKEGRVIAAGCAAAMRQDPRAQGADVEDLGGRAVVPGLIDSHTHAVFAGSRIDEMARRARGETYEQIAEAGGGIVASTSALAAASIDDLVEASLPRVREMMGHGVTTLEVKSGYGLRADLELKQLRAIDALSKRVPATILPTVLAHVIPVPHRSNREAFVEHFITEVIKPAHASELAAYCDVFIESGAYSIDEARALVHAAKELGLGIKLHVDQLRDGGGATFAAECGALSADHLEYVSAEGRQALAQANTIATLLPGCVMFLGKGPWPDGRALRDAGCEVAVATDCNPGSSMVNNLPLCATLAATQCGLTLEEALWGITRGAARALGLDDRGSLAPGERADFVVIDDSDWRALLYNAGSAPIAQTRIAGEIGALQAVTPQGG